MIVEAQGDIRRRKVFDIKFVSVQEKIKLFSLKDENLITFSEIKCFNHYSTKFILSCTHKYGNFKNKRFSNKRKIANFRKSSKNMEICENSVPHKKNN